MSSNASPPSLRAIKHESQGVGENNCGVYWFANDKVLDWTIALLDSFRQYNPSTPLTLIPFDDNISRTIRLAGQYRFGVLRFEGFHELEALGRRWLPSNYIAVQSFRKFAAFAGPYSTFALLDSDIVLLNSLSPLLEAADGTPYTFLYADTSNEMVYKPGPVYDRLITDGKCVGFNGGYWFAKRGALTLAQLRAAMVDAQQVRSEFADPHTLEQPFLNYCVHTLLKHKAIWEVVPDLATWNWYRLKYREDPDGTFRQADASFPDFGKRAVLIHWAGSDVEYGMPYWRLYAKHRLRNETIYRRLIFLLRKRAALLRSQMGGYFTVLRMQCARIFGDTRWYKLLQKVYRGAWPHHSRL